MAGIAIRSPSINICSLQPLAQSCFSLLLTDKLQLFELFTIFFCGLNYILLFVSIKKVLAISKNAMFRGEQKEIVYVLSDKIEV